LEDCLREYTKLELVEEFRCRRCSLLATRSRVSSQLARLREAPPPAAIQSSSSSSFSPIDPQQPSSGISRKKRTRELQKLVNRLDSILASDPESAPPDMKLDRPAPSPASKQTMFARAPKVLTIHLSRSSHFSPLSGHAVKNVCQVIFEEELDLEPFSTSGQLSVSPLKPISTYQIAERASSASTGSTAEKGKATANGTTTLEEVNAGDDAGRRKLYYKLKSVVVHYGSHSFGHYVAYRKIGGKWWKISDETVGETSIEEVLKANPFLMFYEMDDDQDEGCSSSERGSGKSGWSAYPRRLLSSSNGGARVVRRLIGTARGESGRESPGSGGVATVTSSPALSSASSWVSVPGGVVGRS
jgi:ubiquitin carboxyl-terminal hydrolase 1